MGHIEEKNSLIEKVSSIREYDNLVAGVASKRENKLVWNDGVAHDAVIMKEMFKNSRKVNMLCGEGSIFREDFYNKVGNICKGDYDDLMRDMYGEIKNFIKEGKILNVILENGKDFAINVNDEKENLRNCLRSSNVRFYTLADFITPQFHFSVGDDYIYRREIGKKEHKAFANFNDPEHAGILGRQFEMLMSFVKPLPV